MAAGNRSLCQWKCQQVVGEEQMWSDHKESSRLHHSKGMFKVWLSDWIGRWIWIIWVWSHTVAATTLSFYLVSQQEVEPMPPYIGSTESSPLDCQEVPP